MPFAVFKSIREVSSEDKVHCAANLLNDETTKKWKTGETDEKSAHVVIELDKEYIIKGIDIGNEHSAFVEVLVGGATCARENFKELLMTCSFMTPIESKSGANPNRVRCFNRPALVDEIAKQKWKLLKVVCTQPFNRAVKYGLSFIKVHVEASSEGKETNKTNGSANVSALTSPFGNFSLREKSPESESEKTTSLFQRWKTSRNENSPGAGSSSSLVNVNAIKTTQSIARKSSDTGDATTLDRNRDSLLFTKDDDNNDNHSGDKKEKLQKLEKIIFEDQERVRKEKEKLKKPKTKEKTKEDSGKVEKKAPVLSKAKNTSFDNSPSTSGVGSLAISNVKKATKQQSPSTNAANPKAKNTPKRKSPLKSTTPPRVKSPLGSPRSSKMAKRPKIESTVKYKPFHELLRGVTIVISGIQNPDRTDLRQKALTMGAKYKADWDNTCTHLICAFKNTPKYNQVRGHGKIITRSWVEDCFNQKKRFPWRRYAVDTGEITKPESEDEIHDESLKPQAQKTPPSDIQSESNDNDDNIMGMYDACQTNGASSGSDTEDEIQKVLANKQTAVPKRSSDTKDIFEATTEEEDYVSIRSANLSEEKTFFKGLTFFLSSELAAVQRLKLEGYIKSFHGTLTNSPQDADYAISEEANVDECKGEIVNPLWILECNDADCFVPTKRYLVT